MLHTLLGRPVLPRRVFPSLPAVFLLLALILTACGGTPPPHAATSKSGGNLVVALNTDNIITLDPLKSTAFVDRQVMLNLYDTLVTLNAHNGIEPDLATSWLYRSPTQLVFTLRSGVVFQDGTPLNASAVVFTIHRILASPTSPRFSEISTVTSVQAIDPSHVQFNLKKPFSPLLATLTDRSGMILSPTAVQKAGANLGNAPGGAGAGPFQFVEWAKGDHLLLKRNPHYWQKDDQGQALPYLQSVRYRFIANETVEFENLETGTIQVADSLDPNDVATAKTNSNLVYKQSPGLSFYGIALNVKKPPLNNVHVRRAVEWGINRQEIVSHVLKDVGVVSQGPLPPPSWAYKRDFTPYSYDIGKAKSELAQAGVSSAALTLLIGSGSPLTLQEGQFIQSELQPAGITVTLKQDTAAAISSDTITHNFQAALLLWSGRPDPDGNLYTWFHTGGGINFMQYSNPQVDALLDAARTSTDQAIRVTDYQNAQQLILQDAPFVFINYGVAVQATTSNVKNFTLLPLDILLFKNVYLGK